MVRIRMVRTQFRLSLFAFLLFLAIPTVHAGQPVHFPLDAPQHCVPLFHAPLQLIKAVKLWALWPRR
jgi:hypothetical protein